LKRSWRRIKQLFLSRSTTYHPLRGSASLFDQVSLIKKYQYFGTGIHNLKRLCIFTPAGRRCDERRHKPCRPSQHTRSATRAFVPRQRLQPCVDREAVQFHFASIVTALDHSNCFADFVCFSIITSFLLLYHIESLHHLRSTTSNCNLPCSSKFPASAPARSVRVRTPSQDAHRRGRQPGGCCEGESNEIEPLLLSACFIQGSFLCVRRTIVAILLHQKGFQCLLIGLFEHAHTVPFQFLQSSTTIIISVTFVP
jgi:hypothetical protein